MVSSVLTVFLLTSLHACLCFGLFLLDWTCSLSLNSAEFLILQKKNVNQDFSLGVLEILTVMYPKTLYVKENMLSIFQLFSSPLSSRSQLVVFLSVLHSFNNG